MRTCPACKHEVDESVLECPFCGVIFTKWEARHHEETPPPEAGGVAVPSPASPHSQTPAPPSAPPPAALSPAGEGALSEHMVEETVKAASGKGLWILLGILSFFCATWLYLLPSDPNKRTPVSPAAGTSPFTSAGPCPSLGKGDEFEHVQPIPGEPQGLAWGNGEFLIGNRVKPWGFVRVDCGGSSKKLPVKEPSFGRFINFWCVAFNGVEYVSFTDGRWLEAATPDIFIVHDPKSLGILRHFPAPPKIGGLTWDGEYYWAATRKNTADEPGTAYLYKLDARFNEVQKWETPVVGCQGLCWARGMLFWADVFTDQIVLFRIEDDGLVKVHEYEDATNYLSGIAFDGVNLWVTEYELNRLRMLPPRLTAAWFNGDFRVGHFQTCLVARVLLAYEAGNREALAALVAHWSKNPPDASAIHEMSLALDALGVRGPMLRAMDAILADPQQASLHEVIKAEHDKWTESPAPPPGP